jgi:hypothetical protein
MNAKYRAKHRIQRAAALLVTVCLVPAQVTADDGNLAQQLRSQQHKSRFQLMLEQVQERARQRAARGHVATRADADTSTPAALGDWSQSVRLDPITVTGPGSRKFKPDQAFRLPARQAYERDQRRILDHRQQRRALITGLRTGGPVALNSFQAKRRELARFNTQNQRQILQRKLRR